MIISCEAFPSFTFFRYIYTVDVIEMVIGALERDYGVSGQAVKIRLVELGFEEAIGTFNYVDGHYVKPHGFRKGVKKSLPNSSTLFFCKHNAVNILLIYFAQQAKEKQNDFSLSAFLPEQITIPDNVLSALLGNLLENALDACQTVRDRRTQISVKAKTQPDALFLQIENTYCQGPIKDGDGRYLASKRKGPASVWNLSEIS